MEEKLLESNPHFKNQIINMDPFKEIESKYLSEDISQDFSFFIN